MKFLIYFSKKVSLLGIFILLPLLCLAQGNSKAKFLDEISFEELNLNAEEAKVLSRMRDNRVYSSIKAIKLGNIASLQNRGAFPVKIPGRNGSLVAFADRIEAFSETEYTWTGRFKKFLGYMIIVVKDGDYKGHIQIEKDEYEIHSLGKNKTILVKKDKDIYPQGDCAVQSEEDGFHDTHENKATSRLNTCSVPQTVRIAVLYTDNASQAVSKIWLHAQLLVQQTKTAITNSVSLLNNPSVNVELAAVKKLNSFTEESGNTRNIVADLSKLRMNEEAEDLREQYLADVVVLLTDGNYNRRGTALFSGAGEAFTVPGIYSRGFAIVEADAAIDSYTFAHEVGHLFGCNHENTNSFHFPTANANSFDVNGNTFHTVVNSSAPILGQPRVPYYSSPIAFFNNVATGTSNANNAQQIRDQACTLAEYQPLTPLTVQIQGPSTGVQFETHTWCAYVEGCHTNITNYNWEYSHNGFSYGSGTSGSNANCYTTHLPYQDNLYLRLTVTCAGGQTKTAYFTVYNQNNSNCNPCAKVIPDNISSSDLITEQKDFIVYPNPASESINIQVKNHRLGNVEITITDVSGREKLLLSRELEVGRHDFRENIRLYPEGLYLIKVKNGDNIQSKKVLIHY